MRLLNVKSAIEELDRLHSETKSERPRKNPVPEAFVSAIRKSAFRGTKHKSKYESILEWIIEKNVEIPQYLLGIEQSEKGIQLDIIKSIISGVEDGFKLERTEIFFLWMLAIKSSHLRKFLEEYPKIGEALGIDDHTFDLSANKASNHPADVTTKHSHQILMTDNGSVPPYDIGGILASAQESVVFIAQINWHLTGAMGAGIDHWPNVLAALERGVAVEIHSMSVAARPSRKHPDAIKLWALYMRAENFPQHLRHCARVILSWIEKYKQAKLADANLKPFIVYETYFSPLTLTIVDEGLASAYIVVSPRTGSSAPHNRPQFVVWERTEVQAFNYYLTALHDARPNGYSHQVFPPLAVE